MGRYAGWSGNESPYRTPPAEPSDLHLAYVLLGCGIGGVAVAVLGYLLNRADPGDGGAVMVMVSSLLVASAIGYWRIRDHNRLVDDWHRFQEEVPGRPLKGLVRSCAPDQAWGEREVQEGKPLGQLAGGTVVVLARRTGEIRIVGEVRWILNETVP